MVLPALDDVLADLAPAVKVRLVPVEGAAGRGELLEPRLLGLPGPVYDIVERGGITGLAVPHQVGGDHVELDHGARLEGLDPAGQSVGRHLPRQPPAAVILSLTNLIFAD